MLKMSDYDKFLPYFSAYLGGRDKLVSHFMGEGGRKQKLNFFAGTHLNLRNTKTVQSTVKPSVIANSTVLTNEILTIITKNMIFIMLYLTYITNTSSLFF